MKKQKWVHMQTRLYHDKDEHQHCQDHTMEMGSYGWELVAVVPYPSDGITMLHWKQTTENHTAPE